MTTVYAPSRYTGEFATIHFCTTRGWQVTQWQFGAAIGHTPHSEAKNAITEATGTGFMLASEAVCQVFEQDVILAAQSC